MDATAALDATTKDLQEGLRGPFSFPDDAIHLTSPVNDPVLVDDTHAAVHWRVEATHDEPFLGIEATHRTVLIEGVSIIRDPGDGDLQFLRFVDWSDVLGQLGVALPGRGLLPD